MKCHKCGAPLGTCDCSNHWIETIEHFEIEQDIPLSQYDEIPVPQYFPRPIKIGDECLTSH